jgi:hypothetical protein
MILQRRGWKSMPLFKVEVYVDENYLKTIMIEADTQYEADEQIREMLNIDLDIEPADA